MQSMTHLFEISCCGKMNAQAQMFSVSEQRGLTSTIKKEVWFWLGFSVCFTFCFSYFFPHTMETSKPMARPPMDTPPLTVDTNIRRQPSEEESPTPIDNFTMSPTSPMDAYPAPQQMQQALDNEKVELDEDSKPAPVFSALAPRLSIVRKKPTSYQKQNFRMEAGINPAATIAERLQAWRGVLKNLVKYHFTGLLN
jgi:hypothetical protein